MRQTDAKYWIRGYDLGTRVKRAREELGISQHELALRAGFTADYISKVETNSPRYMNPTLYSLVMLAEALAISLADLLSQDLLSQRGDRRGNSPAL